MRPAGREGTTESLVPAGRGGDRCPLAGPAGVQHQPWHFHGDAGKQTGQAGTGEARVRGLALPPRVSAPLGVMFPQDGEDVDEAAEVSPGGVHTDAPPTAEHTRGSCPGAQLATPSGLPRDRPTQPPPRLALQALEEADSPRPRPSTKGRLCSWCGGNPRRGGQAARGSSRPPANLPARSNSVAGEERRVGGSVGSETREQKERGCFCRLRPRVSTEQTPRGPVLLRALPSVSSDRSNGYSHVFPLSAVGHALGNLRTTAPSRPQSLPAQPLRGLRP